jgi:DNA polymerase V
MPAFGLLDCNNFYASVERVFDARLHRRPVVVLTGGENGIIIARSQEAKNLGIGMAQPVFEVRDIIRKNGVIVRTANFELYADMSSRVMGLIEEFSPDIQVYSIDEAFFLVSGSVPLETFGEKVRTRITCGTGLPVSLGFAPTKTLAKLANHLGKVSGKVVDLYNASKPEIEHVLAETPVGEIWGVGPNTTKKLIKQGITTALALRNLDLRWTAKKLSVVGVRTVLELRGTSCYSLTNTPDELSGRQSVTCSRSFSNPVIDKSEMRRAVSGYVTRAAERLRRLGFAAGRLTVSVSTNRFTNPDEFYGNYAVYTSHSPSDSTSELISWAMNCLDRIYHPGLKYKKAGVTLTYLIPYKTSNARLIDEQECVRSHNLMNVIDKMNLRWGRDTVLYAAVLEKNLRREKDELKSSRSGSHTTRYEEMLVLNDDAVSRQY